MNWPNNELSWRRHCVRADSSYLILMVGKRGDDAFSAGVLKKGENRRIDSGNLPESITGVEWQ